MNTSKISDYLIIGFSKYLSLKFYLGEWKNKVKHLEGAYLIENILKRLLFFSQWKARELKCSSKISQHCGHFGSFGRACNV